MPRRLTTCCALAALAAVLSTALTASCAHTARTHSPPLTPPSPTAATPADLPGLHNVVTFHDGLYSGAAPEGPGFDTLAALGVRTIITVDSAAPDLAAAHARGLRYIHLPIGYNGFDDHRRLELARAARDAMQLGPVYIHCHHGKHRSAAAAAAITATLGWSTPQAGVDRMKVAGTAPDYTGLFQCALASAPASAAALDAVPADFPEVSRPAGFTATMVEIDEVFDHLCDIEHAGWTTPAHHPDLVPAAEAARLVDLFRTAHASSYAAQKPADFAVKLTADITRAQLLEDLITRGNSSSENLTAAFKPIGASCKDCHTKHRDKNPW